MRITRKVFSIYSEDELINAIEEKAFNEGYQAAQEDEKGSSTRSKALGYGALGAGAASLGGIAYGTKGGLDFSKTIDTNNKKFNKFVDKIITTGEKHPLYKTVEGVSKGENSDKGLNKLREAYVQDKTNRAIVNRERITKSLEEAAKANPNNKIVAERLSAMKKINRGVTAGRIGAAGALALGAGYGVSRYFDKKKKND